MKIHQDEIPFNPVMITFETPEEFETFMRMLDDMQKPDVWRFVDDSLKHLIIDISNAVSSNIYY